MSRVALLIFVLLWSHAVWAQEDMYDVAMRKYGLVDISSLDSEILVDLKYSTEDNFVGVDMYGDLNSAYFVPEFADRVVTAQRILKSRHPEYTLLIYDAARPISVQRFMRQTVEGTEFESFVADGTLGGRHNYGVAVDLTIATNDGKPLNMGAEFDEFSEASSVKGTPDSSDAKSRSIDVYKSYVMSLAECGIIALDEAKNRILLLEVMCEAGLVPYRREWWHFEELTSMSDTRKKYKLLDF